MISFQIRSVARGIFSVCEPAPPPKKVNSWPEGKSQLDSGSEHLTTEGSVLSQGCILVKCVCVCVYVCVCVCE